MKKLKCNQYLWFCLFLVLSAFGMQSCSNDPVFKAEIVITDANGMPENRDVAQNVLAIESERLMDMGVKILETNPLAEEGHYSLKLKGQADEQQIKRILETRGCFEFWETYAVNELFASFESARNAFLTGTVSDDEPEVAPEAVVSVLDKLTLCQGYGGVGYAYYGDTAAIMKFLNANADLFPKDVKWAWGAKGGDADEWKGFVSGSKEETHFMLYALKGKDGRAALSDEVVDGNMIVKAACSLQHGQNIVNMTMTTDAANVWSKITVRNIGCCIAMVLDGVVYSAPYVNQRIDGGGSQVSGNFTEEEAQDLARLLRNGCIPASVTVSSVTFANEK